jgi:hypothetical protein
VPLTQKSVQGEWQSEKIGGRIYILAFKGSRLLSGVRSGRIIEGRHDVGYSIKPASKIISFGKDGEGRLLTKTTMTVNFDFGRTGKKKNVVLRLVD